MASASEQLARQFNFGAFGKAKDLKSRILFTLGALIIFRLGTHIPVPGVDPHVLANSFAQQAKGILGMFNMFSGGALQRMAIFALGIMPYITASIMIMFMGFSSPAIQQLQKEGEIGRRKLNQYTRYLTVIIALIQGYGAAIGLQHTNFGGVSAVNNPGIFFIVTTMVTLLGGTMFLMWLSEQITSRGIGNGTSIFIFAGIVANLPGALHQTLELGRQGAISVAVVLIIAVIAIATIVFIILMERAQRRVLVQYPKRQVGQKVMSGESSHLPIKLNASGVMGPICASALIMLPATIIGFSGNSSSPFMTELARYLHPNHPVHMVLYAALIILFCFVMSAMIFNPKEKAENLRKANGFIPGIKPGKNTTDYLTYVLNRITVVGSAYIAAVCLLPGFLVAEFNVPFAMGGTALLLAVTVPMDLTAQIHSYLIAHQYEGLMRKTRSKGSRRK